MLQRNLMYFERALKMIVSEISGTKLCDVYANAAPDRAVVRSGSFEIWQVLDVRN
jgi:hypothetical protein